MTNNKYDEVVERFVAEKRFLAERRLLLRDSRVYGDVWRMTCYLTVRLSNAFVLNYNNVSILLCCTLPGKIEMLGGGSDRFGFTTRAVYWKGM